VAIVLSWWDELLVYQPENGSVKAAAAALDRDFYKKIPMIPMAA
jgi:hypothetical protein